MPAGLERPPDDADEEYGPDRFDDEAIDPDDTVPCPSCGRPVFEDAQKCPHCGDWIVPTGSGGRRPLRPVAIAAVLIGLLLLLVLCAPR